MFTYARPGRELLSRGLKKPPPHTHTTPNEKIGSAEHKVDDGKVDDGNGNGGKNDGDDDAGGNDGNDHGDSGDGA